MEAGAALAQGSTASHESQVALLPLLAPGRSINSGR